MDDMPGLVTNVLTPKIIWHQSDTSVVIRIMLCEIKDYCLSISDDYLLFNTILNDAEYLVCIKLYGAVIPEKTTHMNLDREIRIFIEKGYKWLPWLRLEDGEKQNFLIVADPDLIEDRNYRNNCSRAMGIGLGGRGVSFDDYKRINCITNICPAGLSDEGDSDDEKMDSIFDCYTLCTFRLVLHFSYIK